MTRWHSAAISFFFSVGEKKLKPGQVKIVLYCQTASLSANPYLGGGSIVSGVISKVTL